jgi:TDG/mug DNA glycosylase family protein
LRKLQCYQPRYIAFLGKAAYQNIAGRRQVSWGEQAERLGAARVWILPNPSGLNRGFSLDRLVDAYAALRRAAQQC